MEAEEFTNKLSKLKDVGIALSAHTLHGWQEQYNRMMRFYKRTIDATDDIDRLDFCFAFFQNCFHLKDWIPVMEQINKSDWNKKWEKFISKNTEMKICRDICNGTKHLKLDKPSIDKHFALFREYEPYHKLLGERPNEWKIYANGQKHSLSDLMKTCIKSWDDFIANELPAN